MIAELRSSADTLCTHLCQHVTLSSLVRALTVMRKRFRNFQRFIESTGVVYVVRRNHVHAQRAYWRALDGRVS